MSKPLTVVFYFRLKSSHFAEASKGSKGRSSWKVMNVLLCERCLEYAGTTGKWRSMVCKDQLRVAGQARTRLRLRKSSGKRRCARRRKSSLEVGSLMLLVWPFSVEHVP